MNEAWIIDACRTPRAIGKAGKGAYTGIHPQRLGATVLKALAERNKLNTAEVDDILWATSSQRGQQGGDLGRMSALDAGYDVRASAVTLDRFCGSGITSVTLAAASRSRSNTSGTRGAGPVLCAVPAARPRHDRRPHGWLHKQYKERQTEQ